MKSSKKNERIVLPIVTMLCNTIACALGIGSMVNFKDGSNELTIDTKTPDSTAIDMDEDDSNDEEPV